MSGCGVSLLHQWRFLPVEGEDVAVVEDVVADVVEKDEVADVAPVSTPAGVPVLVPDDVEVLASWCS